MSHIIYRTSLALAAILTVANAQAAHVTPEQALARAAKDMPAKAPAKLRMATPQLAHTALSPDGSPAVYVFNAAGRAGYMLLPADDTARPVLGYCDEGSFDADAMPPAMKWWLDEYSAQIEYTSSRLQNFPTSQHPNYTPAREAIEPMITAMWDQIEPYNNMAPLYGSERTYTGCVATTMAMVMDYWNYPEKGQGKVSYTASTIGKRIELDFSKRKFDWDNMLRSYDIDGEYSAEQTDAVAYLMKACGYAVKMDYSTSASATLAMNIGQAMAKYFNYDPNYRYELRLHHSSSEWEQIIYDNLKNVGPVLYGGGSYLGGGHSFVCDGYDGNGFFHFNWGWSGISNGYFSLDALQPDALGSGGGTGGGYSFTQDAVLGIQPPTGAPAEPRVETFVQMGSLSGSISDDNILTFSLIDQLDGSWVNYNPRTIETRFGAIFEPQGDTAGEKQVIDPVGRTFTMKAGYGTGPANIAHSVNLNEAGLSDGTYKVTYAFREEANGTASEWTEVKPAYGYSNYIVLHKAGSTYTVDNKPVERLRIVDGKLRDANIYFGGHVRPSITVENTSDIELSHGFAPVLMYNNPDDGELYMYFLGESEYITVPPHSTVSRDWTSTLYLTQNIYGINVDTDFLLTFFDETTYQFYTSEFTTPVVMHPNAGQPRITLSDLTIEGASTTVEEVGGTERTVYVVDNKLDIPVKASCKLIGTIPFVYSMQACVFVPDWTSEEGTYEILGSAGYPFFLSRNGTSHSFSTTVASPFIEHGQHYMLTLAYMFGSNYVPVNINNHLVFRLADESSSVESVTADPDATGLIYNLQGICLGSDFDALPCGLYIRDGHKIFKR